MTTFCLEWPDTPNFRRSRSTNGRVPGGCRVGVLTVCDLRHSSGDGRGGGGGGDAPLSLSPLQENQTRRTASKWDTGTRAHALASAVFASGDTTHGMAEVRPTLVTQLTGIVWMWRWRLLVLHLARTPARRWHARTLQSRELRRVPGIGWRWVCHRVRRVNV